MIRLQATEGQIAYTRNILRNKDIGQRSHGNGNREQQFIGILAEVMFADMVNRERPKAEGYDGGYDIELFGKKIDIKTMGRNTSDIKPFYAHNLMACQIDNGADGYIFCSMNKQDYELTICGVKSKAGIISDAEFFLKGQTRKHRTGEIVLKESMFEIRQYQLDEVKNKSELANKIWRMNQWQDGTWL